MYGVTDSALKRLASTVPVRQQVSVQSCFFLRPTTRRYEIDLATIEHRKVILSHEAQCDGIVAVGHDAVLCDA